MNFTSRLLTESRDSLTGLASKKTSDSAFWFRPTIARHRITRFCILGLGTAIGVNAQSDPWSTAAGRIGTAFSGPIAKGFALAAIVVGGLEMAFSEGSGRRVLGGLIFGLGLALGAANFISWLFT